MTRTRTTRVSCGQNARTYPAWGHAGSRWRVDPRRAGAFSLMEVLVALGIFALGLVAVAAVFPTAIAIQSETVRDLAGQRAVINAKATLQAIARSSQPSASTDFRALSFKKTIDPVTNVTTYAGTLAPYDNSAPIPAGRTGFPGGVQPMIDQPITFLTPHDNPYKTTEMSPAIATLNAPRSFHDLFSLDARSYPKNIADVTKRDYYWYPFIQAQDLTGSTSTWKIFVMVMQRRGTEAVPEARAVRVLNANNNVITFDSTGAVNDPFWLDNDNDNGGTGDGLPDLIQPGDWLLGDDGSIFRVVIADKNTVTIDSVVPLTRINLLYYAVALDRTDPANPIVKRETRSAIVRIEQFEVVVNEP